ncbi:hypothetical protein KJ359_009535 [Pestalotiopsis sp. 9143b]|nr:hypothetical protein KJ359_009535 [Pestalotiopsis sp. 9143b]
MDWEARLSDHHARAALLERLEEEHRAHKLRSASPAEFHTRQRLQQTKQLRVNGEFHGFMHLPRELRGMVYSLLLAPGLILMPERAGRTAVRQARNNDGQVYERYRCLGLPGNPEDWQAGLGGDGGAGLLRGVSKQIHVEATSAFFRENRIVFPIGPFMTPPSIFRRRRIWLGDQDLAAAEGFVSDETCYWVPLLRDASYTFDMRDVPISDMQNVADVSRSFDRLRQQSQQVFMRALHDNRIFLLQQEWFGRIVKLKRTNLERLQVAFDECYCGYGCCRMVEWVCSHIGGMGISPNMDEIPDMVGQLVPRSWGPEGITENRAPRIIEISGWADNAEGLMIKAKLSQLTSRMGTKEIRFIGESLRKKRAELQRERDAAFAEMVATGDIESADEEEQSPEEDEGAW